MKKWERIVDRQVADAIGDGDVSHLSGAGKKLALPDDSRTPDELRAAFKIMRDHNVMPEWLATGARLEQAEGKLRSQIQTAARRLPAPALQRPRRRQNTLCRIAPNETGNAKGKRTWKASIATIAKYWRTTSRCRAASRTSLCCEAKRFDQASTRKRQLESLRYERYTDSG